MADSSLILLADGNPGAATFLMEVMSTDSVNLSLVILLKIKEMDIKGTDLWVLYSDLGGKDLSKVFSICKKVPTDILKDACSRQDRSGVQLIAPYLEG